MSLKIDKLIRMVNDISNFFNAEPDKTVAAEGVKNHIMRFWEKRMQADIIAYHQGGGEGLSPLAKTAISLLI